MLVRNALLVVLADADADAVAVSDAKKPTHVSISRYDHPCYLFNLWSGTAQNGKKNLHPHRS
jgi:hypothetical protein